MRLEIRKDTMRGNEGGYRVRYFEKGAANPRFSSHVRPSGVLRAVVRGFCWCMYQWGYFKRPYLH